MSVINQMLKDLEHRAPEQGKTPVTTAALQKKSTLKIVIVCTLVLLSLNVVGLYIWSLQERITENNLQQQQAQKTGFKPAEHELAHQQSTKVKQTISLITENEDVKPTIKLTAIAQKPVVKPVTVTGSGSSSEIKNTDSILTSVKPITIAPVVTVKKAVINSPSTMSISRRELTPQELIVQKLAKAEKQINVNEISKAEKLFEEVLIIDAAHKQARKKLAALWFGRQSYQDAVNLLSQGIAIDNDDSELRLMKAKIHLQQGQSEAAYNTLKPLASIEQEEYQLMLANVAQKVQQYSSAISAYQVLIAMQPYSGRWHLGLATVYDKNSQFSLAVNEYALALTKADLSASSVKFAQQRMQALGE